MEEKKITAYKGFDENLCCRGFQYEIGKEYEQEGEIECCRSGFHACTNPFDVLNYYNANGKNRFCEVEQMGIVKTDGDDTKQSSSKIKIKAEIGMTDLFKAGVEWIKKKTDPVPVIEETRGKGNDPSGDDAKIGSSGDYAQIDSSGGSAQIGSSGDYAQIGSSGYSAKIGSSGYSAQIDSSGYSAKIGSSGGSAQIGSSGDYAQIGSSGYSAKIGSSGYSAQIDSSGDYAQIDSSGDYAKIGSSGYSAKIGSSGGSAQIGSSGDYAKIGSSGYSAKIDSTGEDSIICCAGNDSMVKARLGSWITLSEWKYSKEKRRSVPVCVKTEYVDGERIKADTWYRLVDGEFREQQLMEEMWLARDKDGKLIMYEKNHSKINLQSNGHWVDGSDFYLKKFPEVKWSDEEPTKVKLVIDKQYGKGKVNTTKCTIANTEID